MPDFDPFGGDLVFNGINGVTGDYALRPMPAERLAHFISGKATETDWQEWLAQQQVLQRETELEYREISRDELDFPVQQADPSSSYSVKADVDPSSLEQAGWAVVFPARMDTERLERIKEALNPLLELRHNQAGDLFRVHEGRSGYGLNDHEGKDQFFRRQDPEIREGLADPAQMPFYVLLVGSPEEIPYEFQSQLNVTRGVGRIDFGDDVEAYHLYAQGVAMAENGEMRSAPRVSFFSPAHPDDKATQLSSRWLVQPLYENLRNAQQERGIDPTEDWEIQAFIGDGATKARLGRLLSGIPSVTPALLFAAAQGLSWPLGDTRQSTHQGALLCQGWGGPGTAVTPDYYFAGEDLYSDARFQGMVAMFFASYAAGAPRLDGFSRQAFNASVPMAQQSFSANLPGRLLRQGALAVIGHVERVWGYSFVTPQGELDSQAFITALRTLMDGGRIGMATNSSFSQRYAEKSIDLKAALEDEGSDSGTRGAADLAYLWAAYNDARNYLILGDPAVRLSITLEIETTTEREPAVADLEFAPDVGTIPEEDVVRQLEPETAQVEGVERPGEVEAEIRAESGEQPPGPLPEDDRLEEPAAPSIIRDPEGRWVSIDGVRLDVRQWETDRPQAALTLPTGLPPQLFPAEETVVELRVENHSDWDWPVTGPDMVQIGAIIQPEAPDMGENQLWLQPLSSPVPSEGSLTLSLTFTAPEFAGRYQIDWVLWQGEDAEDATILKVEKPASTSLEVVGPGTLSAVLADLPGMSADEERRWIGTIGRAVQWDDFDDALKADLVESGLVPALFSPYVTVQRPALAALYAVRGGALDPEELLREAFKKRDSELEGVRALVDDSRAQPAGAREWLDSLLPVLEPSRPEPERRDAGKPIILPVSLARYEPPPAQNRVTVRVTPSRVDLDYGGNQYWGPNRLNPDALAEIEHNKALYGEELFKGIIHSQLGSGNDSTTTTEQGYGTAFRATEGQVELRLELINEGVAVSHEDGPVDNLDLHDYQWEYLRPQGGRPLAVYERAPFYRQVFGPTRTLLAGDGNKLKVLVAICSPPQVGELGIPYLEDLVELDVEKERDIAHSALRRLEYAGLVEYSVLDGSEGVPVTLHLLREALQEGYHVLHLVCHGLFQPKLKPVGYRLVIAQGDDRLPYVLADQFEELTAAGNLRLAVLAACQSAGPVTGDALRALGPRLVRAGIPAIIAMQDFMPVETAQLFTQHFYDDLARSGRVDMALAATRLSIYQREGAGRGTWGIPVLFMSARDGLLLNVDKERAERLPELVPDIRSHNQLAGGGDPRARVLTQSVLSGARAIGAQQIASFLQQATGAAVEGPALAPGQDRHELNKLTKEVKIVATRPQPLPPAGADEPLSLQKVVEEQSGLKLTPNTYTQIASALNTGKHVILIGPPGAGKTSLAHAVCAYAQQRGLSTGLAFTTATADWTTFDTVGGYVPTANQTLQFRPGTFLQAICRGEWLVIDEINRAEIDKAFGELFTVVSGQRVDFTYYVGDHQLRVLPPDARGEDGWIPEAATSVYDYVVHPSWRIIGTMNVYDKSSLFSLSLAFMRRFAFVDVDLPEESIYKPLRDGWVDDRIPASADRQSLKDGLDRLLERDTALMRKRALGPAIIKDMLEYMGDRCGDNADEAALMNLLTEAFLLYAAPQLDGLDRDGICRIHTRVSEVFGQAAEDLGLLGRIKDLYPYIPDEAWIVCESDGSEAPEAEGGQDD